MRQPFLRGVLVPSCLLLGACDMYKWFDVRHSIQPVAPAQCIGSTLSSTRGVRKFGKWSHDQGSEYAQVELQDSTTGLWRRATVFRDSSGITVEYAWGIGVFAHGPSPAELQRVSGMARRLLTQLRNACAPDAPTVFQCVVDHSRVVSCASPAA